MAPRPTGPAPQPPPDLPADTGLSDTMANYLRTFALWCRNMFNDKLAAHAALPGIMLSGFNAPAGNNPNVYLLQVGNGGTLWLTPVALGSGAHGTAFIAGSLNFPSLTGVTDGSNAPAGQVGEVIYSSSAAVTLAVANWTNILTMTLPPGDWDVTGEARITSAATAPNNIAAAISPSTTPGGLSVQSSYWQFMGTMLASANLTAPLRTCRVNVTVSTPYYLPVYCSSGGTAYGLLYARRAR